MNWTYTNLNRCRAHLRARHVLKKLFLLSLLLISPVSFAAKTENKKQKYGYGDLVCAVALYIGGTWLAYKQLPRLAGQQIEFDAPQFTKIFSSILFSIGTCGGIVGAHQLMAIIREKLNNIGKDRNID